MGIEKRYVLVSSWKLPPGLPYFLDHHFLQKSSIPI
jgi:hypothetical protein